MVVALDEEEDDDEEQAEPADDSQAELLVRPHTWKLVPKLTWQRVNHKSISTAVQPISVHLKHFDSCSTTHTETYRVIISLCPKKSKFVTFQ